MFAILARLPGQQAPVSVSTLLGILLQVLPHLAFYVSDEDLNLGSHACSANTPLIGHLLGFPTLSLFGETLSHCVSLTDWPCTHRDPLASTS